MKIKFYTQKIPELYNYSALDEVGASVEAVASTRVLKYGRWIFPSPLFGFLNFGEGSFVAIEES